MRHHRRTPAAGKAKRNGLTVIQWQLLLCGAVLAAAVLCRLYAPAAFERMRAGYWQYMEHTAPEQGPVRFAGVIWDRLALHAAAAQPPPDDASEAAYVPGLPCVLPVEGAWVSSPYGWRTHPTSQSKAFHRGIDLACAEGTPVRAAMAGSVEYTGYDGSSGNYLKLRHPDGVETVYCHMQYIFARAGEMVAAGQVVGTSGSTGNTTGPHLHFSLLLDDIYYDPAEMLGLA